MGPLSGFYKSIKDAISCDLLMDDLLGIHAIDFSIFLYDGFQSNFENLMLYHQKPLCHIVSIRRKIVEFDNNMKNHSLPYHFVMDGLSHPLKLASKKRFEISQINSIILASALKDPNYDYKTMKDLMASTCILSRPDIHAYCISIFKELGISFSVAPFEADWEITALVKNGQCSYAWSTDGDYVETH